MIRLSIYKNGDDMLDGYTSFWDNLYDHLRERDNYDVIGIDQRDMDNLLAEWGGRVERMDNRGFVCFENERMATLFLLRWA